VRTVFDSRPRNRRSAQRTLQTTPPSVHPAHPRHALTAAATKGLRAGLADGERPRILPCLCGCGHAELLLHLDIAALRTVSHVTRRPDQGFKRVLARLTAVFIDRHGVALFRGRSANPSADPRLVLSKPERRLSIRAVGSEMRDRASRIVARLTAPCDDPEKLGRSAAQADTMRRGDGARKPAPRMVTTG
jgi:hypothetical protein